MRGPKLSPEGAPTSQLHALHAPHTLHATHALHAVHPLHTRHASHILHTTAAGRLYAMARDRHMYIYIEITMYTVIYENMLYI